MIDYAAYLQSDTWKARRERVLVFWGGCCALCSSPLGVQVHHRTYERLGNEKLTDLIPLCDACHGRHHQVLGRSNGVRLIQDVMTQLMAETKYA